jgi:hypothetical protein
MLVVVGGQPADDDPVVAPNLLPADDDWLTEKERRCLERATVVIEGGAHRQSLAMEGCNDQ